MRSPREARRVTDAATPRARARAHNRRPMDEDNVTTPDEALPITAAVLAGGRRMRMGVDKTLLPSTASRSSRASPRPSGGLRAHVVVTNRPEALADAGLPADVRVLTDEVAYQGPLGGLVTALAAGARRVGARGRGGHAVARAGGRPRAVGARDGAESSCRSPRRAPSRCSRSTTELPARRAQGARVRPPPARRISAAVKRSRCRSTRCARRPRAALARQREHARGPARGARERRPEPPSCAPA